MYHDYDYPSSSKATLKDMGGIDCCITVHNTTKYESYEYFLRDTARFPY